MADQTDQQLIQEYLKQGREASLELLVSRHLPAVFYFVSRFVSDPAAAEDLAQDTFVKAWKNLKKYDHGKNFKTWLLAIAKNCCIDHLRKKQSASFSEFENEQGGNALEESLADPGPLPEQVLQAKSFAEEFERALLGLPETTRIIILLYLQEQMTFKEIAAALGQPLDTVKSRYRRGMLSLRKILAYVKTG